MADTPIREELLALADDLTALFDKAVGTNKSRPDLSEHELGVLHNAAAALRLAAKPSVCVHCGAGVGEACGTSPPKCIEGAAPATARWEVGKNGWTAADEITREDI